MFRIVYLLVPVLLPLACLLGLYFFPQMQRRRRLISGGLLFSVVFAVLATNLQGSYLFKSFGWFELSLQGTPFGAVFAITVAFLLTLSGIFGFEIIKHNESNYYIVYLVLFSALQAMACAGSLPLLLAAWLVAAYAADRLVRRTPESLRFYRIGTLLSAMLLLAGTVLTIQAGLPLSFLPHKAAVAPDLCVALLVLGFSLHAIVCQLTTASVPTTIALHIGMGLAGLFGAIQVICYLFRPAALAGSNFLHIMPIICLVLAMAAGIVALTRQNLLQRLSWLGASQSFVALFGICTLSPALFTGAGLLIILGALCLTALFLCGCAFTYAQGKKLVSQMEGIGRQMPLALFCFGCASFGLIGIPPFVGSTARWFLANGALQSLSWGFIAVVILLVLTAVSAFALLQPLSHGFFPGKDFEPDTKMHYGACIGVPILVLAGLLLVVGLFPAKILYWIQAAASVFA